MLGYLVHPPTTVRPPNNWPYETSTYSPWNPNPQTTRRTSTYSPWNQNPSTGACVSNSCEHGGICVSTGQVSYECKCVGAWRGLFCSYGMRQKFEITYIKFVSFS